MQTKRLPLTQAMRATQTLQQAWTQRGLLAWALWPLSLVYGALTGLHSLLYRLGVFKTQKLPVPVVVVGNIVAGGAGKTPTVIALVQHLQRQGIRVGVISRGYGRSDTACREVLSDSLAAEVGDEPALIKYACAAPIFVAKKRADAATALLTAYPNTQVIISDDGLQHHALHHDISITVFDDRGLGNGWLLPAGPLRETLGKSPRKFKTGNALILHTGNHPAKLDNASTSHAPQFTARRALANYALQADGSQVPLDSLNTPNPSDPLSSPHSPSPQRNLLALAGIAKPEAFFDMLRAAGLNLTQTEALPDHFDFEGDLNFDPMYEDESDIRHEKYRMYNDFQIVCTMKDAVKLWHLGLFAYTHALAVPLIFEPEAAFYQAFDDMLEPLLRA